MNDLPEPPATEDPGSPASADTPRDPRTREQIARDKAARGRRRSDSDSVLPRINSFQFRRGRLSPNQQANWDRLWPVLGREVGTEPIDPAAWFGREAPTVLEIGCGTGTSTAAMAAVEPHIDVIAVEVYKPGLAQLLGLVDRNGLTNVRLLRGDGVDVLEHMIAPDSLDGVRIFFPDPWPKARHHKRRILQAGTFDLIRTRLRPGAFLHVATDHAGYAEWIEEVSVEVGGLRRLPAEEYDRIPFTLERPVTKFEDKGLRKDHVITEFLWERTE